MTTKLTRITANTSAYVATAFTVAAVTLILVGVTVAAYMTVSSPRVCNSCHEMQPAVAAWRVSPHERVSCYECHGTPRPWYGAPLSFIERAARLGRDISAHRIGRTGALARTGESARTRVTDAACRHCHDPSRTGTSRFGVRIRHAQHAARNNSCTSCHLWTAHSDPGADRDTLMMRRCYTCHGLEAGAKAPGTCSTCHLEGLDLRPDSHKEATWRIRHGAVSLTDPALCAMCHTSNSCAGCHGLDMPHPAGWEQGTSGHAAVAKRGRAVCAKCHTGKTNLCTMCHHQGYDDRKGPWVRQHQALVKERGSAFCTQCHEGDFCVDCHSATRPSGGALTQP